MTMMAYKINEGKREKHMKHGGEGRRSRRVSGLSFDLDIKSSD